MTSRAIFFKILFLSLFAASSSNTATVSASPSVSSVSITASPTQSIASSPTSSVSPGGGNGGNQGNGVGNQKGSISVSIVPSPSSSIAVAFSSSLPAGGNQNLLTPQQKTAKENFDSKRKDLETKTKLPSEINALEASGEDISYIPYVEKMMKESQNFGRQFNMLGANVDYETFTKENAIQTKKFDCVKDRLNYFPMEINSRSVGAGANLIGLPLECPIIVIKDPSSRKRRDVEMTVELEVDDLPMIEEDPAHYAHIYRYMRTRREIQANQNNSACLQKMGSDCLDKRIKCQFKITNVQWNPVYKDKSSVNFTTLTNKFKDAMKKNISDKNSSWKVKLHDFKLSSGSVVVDFYIDTQSSTANDLKAFLKTCDSIGEYKLNKPSSQVEIVQVVHGGWSDWSNWPVTSPAKFSNCGQDFKVKRTRTCTKPSPSNGGNNCTGPSEEYKSCEHGDIQKNGGSISSPYWSTKNYPNNVNASWILEAPVNYTVELTISEFHLEKDKKCFYDYVKIFDGNSMNAKVLMPNTCGNTGVNKTIKSSGTTMTVYFKSDSSVSYKGFTASWKKVEKPYIPPKPIRYKEQNVTVTNVISCPSFNNSLVSLGKATTCTSTSNGNDCYFDSAVYIISCIIGVTTDRNDIPATDGNKINVTFKHIMHQDLFPSYYLKDKTCVTWNSSYSKGNFRAWSKKGCYVKSTNFTHTVCECYHTGIFAVLSTDKVVHKKFSLLANTYAGIGVSFALLIIAILHIVWKVNIHGGEVMRINICVAVILMLMTFLIGANVEAEKHLCGFLAFLEYFSVVAQFFWLMLHGLRIHGKIKEIFTTEMNIEIVYVVFGWGLPLVLSLIAMGIQVDIKNPQAVCWTAIAGGSMWGYGAPLLIVILLNIAVLAAVAAPTQERKTKYLYYPMVYRMLKDAVLLALFGSTCITAYLTVEQETFKPQYFLTVSVVLQAVAMIIFGREGRKDYVRRDKDGKGNVFDNEAFSEHTNEISFEKFDDSETSSNRSSKMSHKDPRSPESIGMKLKTSRKPQETDMEA